MDTNSNKAVIRKLTPAERDESLRLSAYAFQFELTEKDWAAERDKLEADWIWGAFVDGKLAAQVFQIPLEMYINGRKMAMGGIGAVSSWPEARRGGLVAGLLVRIIEAMKADGQVISMLAPFSYAFYRKYGWEMAIDRKKYTVPAYRWPIPAHEQVPGRIERLPLDEALLIDMLGPVYEAHAARFNGTLSRTREWWGKEVIRKKRGEFAVYRDEDGRIQGYLHYIAKKREVTVHEFVALTPDAERGLWRFIGLHDSMAERAVLYVPVDDGLSLVGAEPRFGQEIEPYFMARIVDMEAFLRQYAFTTREDRPARWANGSPVSITLEVSDDHAAWNNGRFTVTVDELGNGTVSRGDSGAGHPLVKGNIQAFSALFVGYRSASELQRIGRLSGEESAIGLLQSLIPATTPFLCDFF